MNLDQYREEGFESCPEEELDEIHKLLNIRYRGWHLCKPEKKRQIILGHLGEAVVEIVADDDGDSRRVEPPHNFRASSIRETGILPAVNLGPNDAWGGMRMEIVLNNNMRDSNPDNLPQFAAWENLEVYIPYDVQVSIPWPIWHILENAEVGEVRISKEKDEDGEFVSTRQVWTQRKRFSYHTIGVTPGTDKLPKQLIEHFQQAEIVRRLQEMEKQERPNRRELMTAAQMLDVQNLPWVDDMRRMSSRDLIDGIYDRIGYDVELAEIA